MRPFVIALMLFLGVPAFGAVFMQSSAGLSTTSNGELSRAIMRNVVSPETPADASAAAQAPTAQPAQTPKPSKRHRLSLFWYPVILVGVAFIVVVIVR